MENTSVTIPNARPALADQPRGVIVPTVTPLDDRFRPDLAGNSRLLEHVISGGVNAIFALGTTGEGPSLSAAFRRILVQHTCEQTANRVPVYIGVTDTSLADSISASDYAAEHAATAVVIAPSPYFPMGAREQYQYFNDFADRSALPVILYNIPQLTKTALSTEAFQDLLHHPKIIGVKDSSGQMVYFRRLQHIAEKRLGFSVLVGADELMAEAVLLGAHGGVTGGANLAPTLFKALFAAASRRDLGALAPLQQRVMELSCRLYAFQSGTYVIQSIKALLAARGMIGPTILPPLAVPAAELSALLPQISDLLEQPIELARC